MQKTQHDIQRILQCLGGLARRFHMHNHRKPMFGEETLGRAQIEILMILAHEQCFPTMHDLAKRLRVTNGAVTQMIAPLMRRELIEKRADGSDKRLVRLVLTKKTVAMMAKAKRAYVRAITPAFASLTERDVRTLARILSKLSLSYDTHR